MQGHSGRCGPALLLCLAWARGQLTTFCVDTIIRSLPQRAVVSYYLPCPPALRGRMWQGLEFRRIGVRIQHSLLLPVWLGQVISPLWATLSCC